jgi:DNA-binding transcriptional LysR family regulator
MMAQLSIRVLELVIALHEEGTFTQAAKRMGMTEPALSKRLQLIEHKVQARLFERGRDGAKITDAGRILVAHADEIVHTYYRAIHEIQEARHGERYKLRIGVSAYLSSMLIETLHSIQLPHYLDFMIEITTGFSADMVTELQQRKIDMALVTSPTQIPVISTHCVATNSFMIAFRDDHPLAARTLASFAEVAGYPWIFFKRCVHPALHDLILQRVNAEHPPPHIVHQVSHADQVGALLTNNSIVAWLNPAGIGCFSSAISAWGALRRSRPTESV